MKLRQLLKSTQVRCIFVGREIAISSAFGCLNDLRVKRAYKREMQEDTGNVSQSGIEGMVPKYERLEFCVHQEKRHFRQPIVGSKNGLPDTTMVHHDRGIGKLSERIATG